MIKGYKSISNIWQKNVLSTVSGATIALIIFAVLTRAVTVLTQMVIASKFGMSIESDAYFATETIPEIFISIVAIGFSMVFIPAFSEYQLSDTKRAQRFANSFFLFTAVLSLLITILFIWAAPLIVEILAPGFKAEGRRIAISLVRVMALSILFLGLDSGIRGLLHAHNRFVISEVSRILYNASLMVAAIYFSGRFGIIALAWGIVVGSAFQLILQVIGASRSGSLNLSWEFDWADMKVASMQFLPFIVAVINIQVLMFIDRMVASELSVGSLAALNYALRIILLPVGIFALPLRTTLYPNLSKLAVQKRLDEIAETVLSGLRFLLYCTIPASMGIVILRFPLTRLLFERGAFDAGATAATSEALFAFALGVPAIALIFVLNNVFLALGKARILIVISLMAWCLNWGLNYFFFRWGHIGISLATSITAVVLVVVMIVALGRNYLPALDIRQLGRSVAWISLTTLVMGICMIGFSQLIGGYLKNHATMHQIIEIISLSGFGILIYFGASYLFNLDEYQELVQKFYWR